jgi:glyoxylase-like metal-dependent hydrolase (beta-lactamase superfamily II)
MEPPSLVDTGYPGDQERLFRSLELIGRRASDVDAVVLTHGHPDHLGSAEHLRRAYGVPVLVHEAEVPKRLRYPGRTGQRTDLAWTVLGTGCPAVGSGHYAAGRHPGRARA